MTDAKRDIEIKKHVTVYTKAVHRYNATRNKPKAHAAALLEYQRHFWMAEFHVYSKADGNKMGLRDAKMELTKLKVKF